MLKIIMMLNTGTLINKTLSLLNTYSDQYRKGLSEWYFPTSMKVIGLKSEDLKKVIKIIRNDIAGEDSGQIIRLCKEMALAGIFEVQQVAFGLLNKKYRIIEQLELNDVLVLATYMDNWASTDSFGTQVSGPAWRLGCISDDDVKKWASSADRWWRRIALVSTVALNLKSQKGEGDTGRTLMICEMLLGDRDDMVIKALSWALRELSKRYPGETAEFIESHKDVLAGRVIREVTRKLLTGRKN
ncbi:MAG: DNA alkylation repair protein [Bacteroidales bacterium]|nr:DNA alkylation repair protein [Bacteroidales bacterium]